MGQSFKAARLLAILGPTATGKTDLALKLAKKFNGEIISCDSRQVYKDLDIGTGKMPGKFSSLKMEDGKWIVDGIEIQMYDVVAFKKQYTVADYVKDARRAIKDVQGRKKLPIVVGGTGLYLKALLLGLSNLSIPIDYKLRQQLEKLSVPRLQEKLKKLSIQKWNKLNHSDNQNPRRLVRAIELEVNNNDNIGQMVEGFLKGSDVLRIGLSAARAVLYQRSDERVVKRINQGMIEEARYLKKRGLSLKRMKQLGLEYRVLADYFEGKIISKEELITILQGRIHNYIRRQITWFKKEKNVIWFDITKEDFSFELEKRLTKWYHHPHAS